VLRAVVILALAGGGCVAVAGGPKEGVVAAALGPPVPVGYGRGDIAGSVVVERPASRVPVAFETVGLYQRGELVTRASTDVEGRFRFLGLTARGRYEVRLLSDRFAGSVPVIYTGRPRRDVELCADGR
jgi:hypothetical protein